MRRFMMLAMGLLVAAAAVAWNKARPFEGHFDNHEQKLQLQLSLYDTTLVVKDYEFLGKMNGCLRGDLYDVWFVTGFKIKGNTAELELSNDLGSESQQLTLHADSAGLQMDVVGGNNLRKVVRRKWAKVPDRMHFKPRW